MNKLAKDVNGSIEGSKEVQPIRFIPTEIRNTGSPDDQTINGTNDADTLFGGAGCDTIYGLQGDDDLFGGSGGDEFVFQNDFGANVVLDFDPLAFDEFINLASVTNVTSFADMTANHLSN